MQLIISETVVVFSILLLMEMTKRYAGLPNQLSGREFQYSKTLLACFAIAIIIPAAFRFGYSDTANYKGIYVSTGGDFANAFNDVTPFEPGYDLFMILMYNISPNPQFIVFVTSVFIISLDIIYVCKYSSDYPFSFFLYFILTYMTALNGIRQSMAAAVLTIALPLILNKKAIWYLALVGLASTFHKSALIMFPLYFVISGRKLNKGIYAVLAVALFSAFIPGPLYAILGALLEDSDYSSYLTANIRGMNALRLLAHAAPFALAFICAKKTPDENDSHGRLVTVLCNMQLVSFAFSILSMKMIFFSRAAAYMRGTTSILLPMAIERVFLDQKKARLVSIIAVFLYSVFWYFDIRAGANYGQWDVFWLNWSIF